SMDWLNETTLEFRSKEKLRRVFSSNAMLGFKLPENPTGASNRAKLRKFVTMRDDEKCREFWDRVGESEGFDIEHLMDNKPKSCLLHYENSDFDSEVFLYAKLGIHKYNMLQGTNLKLSCIEKCNIRSTTVYTGYSITLVAKDPSAGGSLVTFQTKVVNEDHYKINTLTVSIARLKSEPPRANPEHHGSLLYDCAQVRLPDEWPSEDSFNDKKRYYVMKKSELRKHDWIRLYMELAFIHANEDLPNPNLSNLVIMKVAVETEENVKPPNERLKARNAVFYIRYRYYPNKGRAPKGNNGHKPPRDRVAIVKRTMDMNKGLLKLMFDNRYAKTLL
ncbi:Protein MS5, partial [Arabidopsis suecica]